MITENIRQNDLGHIDYIKRDVGVYDRSGTEESGSRLH